jgi:hypothetical protein
LQYNACLPDETSCFECARTTSLQAAPLLRDNAGAALRMLATQERVILQQAAQAADPRLRDTLRSIQGKLLGHMAALLAAQ